jgi:beta-galactosidase
MFFQLRRSIGACEKYHGAVIEHVGHEHTRVFRECAELGKELQALGDTLLDSRVNARVGIVFDWDNWWAIEYSSGPTIDLKYLNEVQKYYNAFFDQNIQVDMIGVDSDPTQYDLIIAPVLYMVKQGFAKRLEEFVANGGSFVTTFFSGIVNECDLVTMGGYPGELRKLLGIWVEEIDALQPDMSNKMVINGKVGTLQGEYRCNLLCDLLHSEGADVLAVYGDDFYKGMPVLTRNHFGKGQAWYVASSPDQDFLRGLVAHLCEQKGINPILQTPQGVEVSRRVKNGTTYTFVMNHNEQDQIVDIGEEKQTDLLTGESVNGRISVPKRGICILQS